MCALAIGAVGLASVDLPGLIPIPIVAGLVFYLGYTFVLEAFRRPFAQRAWPELLMAIGIMIVCVRYGYLAGVLVGLVGACLVFATSYARIGVMRRGVTRGHFASYVHRSPHASEHLGKAGEAIRIYWLSGDIFFGSSENVFTRIRGDIEDRAPRTVVYVIVHFRLVSGVDSSAVMSLTKLRHYCEQNGVTLVCCSLSSVTFGAIQRGGVLGGKSRHPVFAEGESLRLLRIMTHTPSSVRWASFGDRCAPPRYAQTGRPRCSRSRATASSACSRVFEPSGGGVAALTARMVAAKEPPGCRIARRAPAVLDQPFIGSLVDPPVLTV